MPPTPVTAIVVTYQSRDTVANTMESLRKAHERGLLDCVVVDNASTDGTAAFLLQEHGWARVIQNPRNVGYGRALNRGFECVETDYVMFMNPDAVIAPDALEVLVDFLARTPGAGIVAPAIEVEDGTLQAAGGLPTPWRVVAAAAGFSAFGPERREIVPGSEPFRTDWLCGALLLARRTLINQLGGFDPRFFLYFEETDLCRRARLAGSELWAVGQAVAYHVGGASGEGTEADRVWNCISDHYYRSRYYYLKKHHGWLAATGAEMAELVLLALRDVRNWVLRHPSRPLAARLKAPILRCPQHDA